MFELPIPTEFALESIVEVCIATGRSAPQRIYEDVRGGTMTRPIKCGRSSRWPRHEHQYIAAARIAGASHEDLRSLVNQLHELRQRIRPATRAA